MDNPDSERVRNVVLGYRKIIDEAIEVQEQNEPSRETVVKITSVMDRAQELVGRVKSSDEAVLDAKVLGISSMVLKHNAETFDTNLTSYNMKVFSDNINCFLNEGQTGEQNNWDKLSAFAKACMKYQTPSFTCMYGTFQVGEVVVPHKKVLKRKDKIEEAKKKQPENVDKVEKEEDGIEDTVNYILKILVSEWKKNGRRPICYYKLVINPESFGATVENIFHISFLVKNGHVNIKYDEDEFPVIEPVSPDVAEDRKRANTEKNQIIISINMQQWKQLIKAFEISKPMIQPRSIIQASQK